VISSVTQEVGYFTSHQSDAGEFPYMYGPPYHDTYCAGVKVLGVCVGTVIDEEGFYHVTTSGSLTGTALSFPLDRTGTRTERRRAIRNTSRMRCATSYTRASTISSGTAPMRPASGGVTSPQVIQ